MKFQNNKVFDDLINDILFGLEIVEQQLNYVLCTPGLNILFWLLMVEILIALVLTDLSNHHTLNYF